MKYIILLVITAISLNSYCQTTFDVFNYTEPAGWNKETKSTMVSYSTSYDKKGSICMISLYANSNGKETQRANFDNEWHKLVASKLGVTDKPEVTKAANVSGWETMTGVAEFEFNKVKAAAMLTTFTNSGKTASLLCVFNDQEYVANFSSFITNLSLGKLVATENQNKTESGTGVLSDYVFTSPPGFTKEVKANQIVLTDASVPMIISILPMQPSSGNLETDMETIFFSVFRGWSNYANFGPQSYDIYKGTTANGYNYIMEHRDVQQITNSGQIGITATLILVQVKNQIAVFAGSFGTISGPCCDSIEQVRGKYIYLLHSISFKNFIPTPAPMNITGNWVAKNYPTTASNYDFHANGTYSCTVSSFFKTSYSSTHDKVTTTTREHNGKWSLKGNELTIYNNNTKVTSKNKIRIFYDKIGEVWVKKLGWFGYYEPGSVGKPGGFAEQHFFPENR